MCNRPNGDNKKRIINKLLRTQGKFCCYCEILLEQIDTTGMKRRDVPSNAMTLEHLHRLEDGGTNQLDNLALACYSCNVGRGTVDWFTYKNYKMGELY